MELIHIYTSVINHELNWTAPCQFNAGFIKLQSAVELENQFNCSERTSLLLVHVSFSSHLKYESS